MREISDNFKKILQQDTTNLVLCWKITRIDNTELCFTEASCDIKINNQIYKASSGLSSSAIKEESNFSVDNLDIDGILDSENIKADDILKGLYDNAMIVVYLVDLTTEDKDQNKINTLFLKRGYIGNIKILGNDKFVAEINGFLETGKQSITCRYSMTCRANLGDERCQVNLENFTHQGFITKVIDDKTFEGNAFQENGYFDHGSIVIFHGLQFFYQGNIKFSLNSVFELIEPSTIDFQSGMTYYASAGCDKSPNSCIKKFNNMINFRGEPHIPGIEKLYSKDK